MVSFFENLRRGRRYRVNMIEFIFIIVGIAMIAAEQFKLVYDTSITKESESQRRERKYLSEQRENKLNENR